MAPRQQPLTISSLLVQILRMPVNIELFKIHVQPQGMDSGTESNSFSVTVMIQWDHRLLMTVAH